MHAENNQNSGLKSGILSTERRDEHHQCFDKTDRVLPYCDQIYDLSSALE